VSISPAPDGRTEPSLRGVGELMRNSGVAFTREVGALVEWIGEEHEPPVTCSECRDRGRDDSYPCLSLTNATAVAFQWLLDVIEERD
jgi:hypothetical protein